MLFSDSSKSFRIKHGELVQNNSVLEPSDSPVHPPMRANFMHLAPHAIECILCHYCDLGVFQNILDDVSRLAQHPDPAMEFCITSLDSESAVHSFSDFPFANPSQNFEFCIPSNSVGSYQMQRI